MIDRANIRTMLRLAWRDLVHDRTPTALTTGLFGALFLPTLLLYILKFGVIAAWAEDLSKDVWSREVVVRGEYDGLTPERIVEIAAWPETGFVVPEPLHLIKSRNMRRLTPERGDWATVDMRTTAPGDPILAGTTAPGASEIALSSEAADALQAKIGDTLGLELRRDLAGRPADRVILELTVSAVIARALWPAGGVFLGAQTTMGVQNWVTGRLENATGIAGYALNQSADTWRGMRIYAPDVRSTVALEERLNGIGYETTLRAASVEDLVNIETGLSTIFRNLLIFNALSFSLAIFMMQWLGVRRKRAELALMAVAGFSRAELQIFPIVQGLLLTMAAYVSALVLALVFAAPLGRIVAAYVTAEAIHLPPAGHFVLGALCVLVIGLVSSVLAVRSIGTMDITHSLRSD